MRFLLKVSMPVEKANALVRNGTLPKVLQSLLAELKPEAVYFVAEDGKRTAYIVVHVKDPSQMPSVAEPFFLALDAAVQFYPAMTAEDLAKAGPDMERIAKKYG